MRLDDKKVLVVGTGISGIAATELLVGQKIDTVLYDGNKELDLEKLYAKSEVLRNVPLILGEISEEEMAVMEAVAREAGVMDETD